MPPKALRKRVESEDSSSEEDTHVGDIKERIEDLKFIQKLRQKTHGIEAHLLATGEASNSKIHNIVDNDPWKLKTGGLVDMKRVGKDKGNDVLNNMKSNFARETNQRDEDAEMQKFIEEQVQMKKKGEQKASQEKTGDDEKKIKKPDDALFDVPKHLIANHSKHKSEETLSEQMLSGIPEVDLGIEEKIRNIEDTERAKQRVISAQSDNKHKTENHQPQHTAVNFVQHKRFDDTLINQDRASKPKHKAHVPKPETPAPTVGDTDKHELLQKDSGEKGHQKGELKRPHGDKASDDYCFERFRKNMRHNRGSKIKIA